MSPSDDLQVLDTEVCSKDSTYRVGIFRVDLRRTAAGYTNDAVKPLSSRKCSQDIPLDLSCNYSTMKQAKEDRQELSLAEYTQIGFVGKVFSCVVSADNLSQD